MPHCIIAAIQAKAAAIPFHTAALFETLSKSRNTPREGFVLSIDKIALRIQEIAARAADQAPIISNIPRISLSVMGS
jgi:hypothetical protein